jgi:hypothetical protein
MQMYFPGRSPANGRAAQGDEGPTPSPDPSPLEPLAITADGAFVTEALLAERDAAASAAWAAAQAESTRRRLQFEVACEAGKCTYGRGSSLNMRADPFIGQGEGAVTASITDWTVGAGLAYKAFGRALGVHTLC